MLLSSPGFANQTRDLMQDCVRTQLKAHGGMKKSMTEIDFQPYCACVAKTLESNLSNRQLNDLQMNGLDKKPDWFGNAQQTAEKSCLMNSSPKIQT